MNIDELDVSHAEASEWRGEPLIALTELVSHVDLLGMYGEIIAVKAGNQIHIGRLKRVRASTRGNKTDALVRTTIVRRNGRVTKHGTIPIWTITDRQGCQKLYRFVGEIPASTEGEPSE